MRSLETRPGATPPAPRMRGTTSQYKTGLRLFEQVHHSGVLPPQGSVHEFQQVLLPVFVQLVDFPFPFFSPIPFGFRLESFVFLSEVPYLLPQNRLLGLVSIRPCPLSVPRRSSRLVDLGSRPSVFVEYVTRFLTSGPSHLTSLSFIKSETSDTPETTLISQNDNIVVCLVNICLLVLPRPIRNKYLRL